MSSRADENSFKPPSNIRRTTDRESQSGSNFPITQAQQNENNLLNGSACARHQTWWHHRDKSGFISDVQEMNIFAYGSVCRSPRNRHEYDLKRIKFIYSALDCSWHDEVFTAKRLCKLSNSHKIYVERLEIYEARRLLRSFLSTNVNGNAARYVLIPSFVLWFLRKYFAIFFSIRK